MKSVKGAGQLHPVPPHPPDSTAHESWCGTSTSPDSQDPAGDTCSACPVQNAGLGCMAEGWEQWAWCWGAQHGRDILSLFPYPMSFVSHNSHSQCWHLQAVAIRRLGSSVPSSESVSHSAAEHARPDGPQEGTSTSLGHTNGLAPIDEMQPRASGVMMAAEHASTSPPPTVSPRGPSPSLSHGEGGSTNLSVPMLLPCHYAVPMLHAASLSLVPRPPPHHIVSRFSVHLSAFS